MIIKIVIIKINKLIIIMICYDDVKLLSYFINV